MTEVALAPGQGQLWIPGSRWRLAILTLGSLGMAAASVFAASDASNAWYHVVGIFGVFLFGLGAIALALRVVRPGGVQLTREGFTAKALWRGYSRRWSEIDTFQVVQIGRSDYVGYLLNQRFQSRPFGGVTRQVSGVDGMLPGQLAVRPKELVRVLEEWRARYGSGAAERS